MKASELREQGAEELVSRLEELEEESFNLRFQHSLGQLSSPLKLRDVRRDIARVRTLLQENNAAVAEAGQEN
ncbi:MAG TPA: 50S ribosomal protein L29 [Candidatus Handelsmanbacteria bacterium]|jgi:large subunit ribosomal protein L29|nr:50S ribosomal protein L29 [Candidatus Latescibacterota bacterium]HIG18767.1 50S ribosomal protein L29 [Candidatus Handelsmanbacteria bacterium]|tara:strand:- start:3337 stop:3552 length:216 start_codon:yes stop_codon:yes gene_type:complete